MQSAHLPPVLARQLWHRLETVHAVTYFSPESRDAATQLGLRGFWMGYFAQRGAPMGAVSPSVIDATFFNFHPARVRRAIPDAWTFAEPDAIVSARCDAAAAALRRILGDEPAERLAALVVAPAEIAIAHADGVGRPLFAANRSLPRPDDPVAAAWQATTTLREHRGDGHVAALVTAGLDGCAAQVLFAASEGVAPLVYRESRGWSADDWAAATERLAERDLLDPQGAITDAGQALRAEIEQTTDRLAVVPYAAVGLERLEWLLVQLDPFVEMVTAAGDIPFPNPMGLPLPVPAHEWSH
ncbi:MAG: hypothetical protein AAGC53_11380 [Actinomycetota bacterium]